MAEQKLSTSQTEDKILAAEQAKGNTLGSRLITGDELGGGREGQLVFGERDPETGTRFESFTPNTTKPVLGVNGGPQPNQGTGDLRDEVNNNTQDVNSAISGADEGSESPSAMLARLSREREDINKQTADDIKSIDAAGAKAGSEFDPLIADAEERRKKTLPSAIVRAGEAGGFENTQMAGVAAVLPTDPRTGEPFVGAGGRLDVVRQDLDRNVSLLRSKRLEAMASARAAQAAAIRSGKSADFKDALELVKLAQQFKTDEENMMIKRNQFLLDVRQEERLSDKSSFDIASSIPAGQTVDINGTEYTGLALENIDPFFTGSNVVSIMKELQVGESITLPDPNTGMEMTIMGLRSDDPNLQITQASDDRGNLTITTVDKSTGEIVNQVSGGQVGKTKTQAANVSLNIRQETGALISNISDALEGDKGTDGKVNPATYGQKEREFVQGQGGNSSDFRKLFPPIQYLSTENPASLEYFKTTADVVDELTNEEEPLF